MPKFFVKTENIIENRTIIIDKDVNHIKKVLRMKQGDTLQICNQETGQNYKCSITKLDEDKIECEIQSKLASEAEPNLSLTIMQGLPKADKMELIIQKAVELGVTNIIPVKMENCVVKLDNKEAGKKQKRWQTIAEVAAKQCKRDKIPEIENVTNLLQIEKQIPDYDMVLVAYEKEEQVHLKEKIEELKQKEKAKLKIAVLIGPEGGISPQEIAILERAKAQTISLGKRILRTETVAFVMTSILMYELGDLN